MDRRDNRQPVDEHQIADDRAAADATQGAPLPDASAADDSGPAGRSRRRTLLTVFLWLAAALGFVFAYRGTFAWMWQRWFPSWRHEHYSLYDRIAEGESYYTHGPLVPIISLIIIIMLIRRTRIAVRPQRALGLAIVLASLLAHLAATFARIDFISGFTMIGLVTGVIVALWGLVAIRRLWFPVALLAFMVPLPEFTIADMNYELKMFAAQWGVRLANVFGTIAVQDSNRVWLDGERSLIVANVCNGLRTLISVIGFGALYAYVCRLNGLWRVLLFAMSVPVAVVANSIRIASLIIVADRVSVEAATGWYHDASGLMIFLIAFMLMFGIERAILSTRQLIGKPATVLPLFHGVLRTEDDHGQSLTMVRSMVSPRGAAIVILLVLFAGMTGYLNRSQPPVWQGDAAAGAIPVRMDIDGNDWLGQTFTLDQRTLTILETNDYLLRRYSSAGDAYVDFCIIFSQDNRKGTHPPDLCLQGSGEGIVYKRDFVVEVAGVGAVPCRELVVQAGQRQDYFLYTYKCGQRYTNSFWTQQFTIFWNGLSNRNSSGALIRLSTPVESRNRGDYGQARQRSIRFLRASMDYVHRNLP